MGGIVATVAGTAAGQLLNSFMGPGGISYNPIELTQAPTDWGGQQMADAYRQGTRYQNRGIGRGINTLQRGFRQNRRMMMPSIQRSQAAREMQADLSGLNGPEAQQAAYANIQASPAQQWIRDQGEKAMQQWSALNEDFGSGRTGVAMQDRGMNYAMQDADALYQRLDAMSMPGEQFMNSLMNQRTGLSQNIAGLRQQQGQNRATGTIAANQALVDEIMKNYQADLTRFNQATQNSNTQLGVDQANAEIAAGNMENALGIGGLAAGYWGAGGGRAGATAISDMILNKQRPAGTGTVLAQNTSSTTPAAPAAPAGNQYYYQWDDGWQNAGLSPNLGTPAWENQFFGGR